MPRLVEPGGVEGPRSALPDDLHSIMLRELPGLVDEIVDEIRGAVPEYARSLDGPYGQVLRSGVERTVTGFVEWVRTPAAPLDRRDEMCRRLGRFEAYEGRQLDTLQSAYRVGAQAGWRRVVTLHRRHNLSPATVSVLADALFTYMEQLAALSLEGFLEAKERINEGLESQRRRLLHLIVTPSGTPLDAIAEHAGHARWTVPAEVTLVAVRRGAPVVRTLLDDDLLLDLDDAEPCLLVPGPLAEDRRAMLEAALAETKGAAGLTVPLTRAADSLRWARRALDLVHREVIDDGPLTRCEDHLVSLWLLADGALADQIARRRLAAFTALGPRQRVRLTDTLHAWLRTRGTAARVGEELGVHPQTVRYRMRQIEQLIGAELADPDARFAIEAVLRSHRLGKRSAHEGGDPSLAIIPDGPESTECAPVDSAEDFG